MLGKFKTLFETKRKYAIATIYVTQEDGGCLLSSNTAQELEIMRLNLNAITSSTTRNENSVKNKSRTTNNFRNEVKDGPQNKTSSTKLDTNDRKIQEIIK